MVGMSKAHSAGARHGAPRALCRSGGLQAPHALLCELGGEDGGHAEQGIVEAHHGVRLGARERHLGDVDGLGERGFYCGCVRQGGGVVLGYVCNQALVLQVAGKDGLQDGAVDVIG